jgi:hypothetical protein
MMLNVEDHQSRDAVVQITSRDDLAIKQIKMAIDEFTVTFVDVGHGFRLSLFYALYCCDSKIPIGITQRLMSAEFGHDLPAEFTQMKFSAGLDTV